MTMDWILLDSFTDPEKRQWIALAVGMIAVTYLLFRGRGGARRKDPLEKPLFSSLSSQRAVERQMQGLLVELSEMARQISAQLDTRSAKLELLIKEADQKILELKEVQRSTVLSSSAAATALYTPINAADTATTSPVPDAPPDPRHADVYALADQGRSPSQIGTALGRPSGEIELILALRSPRT
jgi:hypothetical protein